MRTARSLICCFPLLAWAAACSGEAAGGPDGGSDSDTDGDADTDIPIDTDTITDDPGVDEVDPSTLVGRIQILEVERDNTDGGPYSCVFVWGLFDRPYAAGVFGDWTANWTGEVWYVTEQAGGCFLAINVGFGGCEPACAEQEYCTPQGDCEPDPQRLDAGPLVFFGLAAQLVLQPNDLLLYNLLEELPADLFAPGDLVGVQAQGADLPGFTAAATGVTPIEPEAPCDLQPTAGEALQISWDAVDGDEARVLFELQSGHHGGSGPLIRCESADDGEIVVPASLVDAYLAAAGEAMQTIVLERFDRTAVEVEPGEIVALEVGSQRVCLP